jgi:hypothetical protein
MNSPHVRARTCRHGPGGMDRADNNNGIPVRWQGACMFARAVDSWSVSSMDVACGLSVVEFVQCLH